MKTLIIGLGNPILGDDGIGWRAAEAVEQLFSGRTGTNNETARPEWLAEVRAHHPEIEVDYLSVGGLGLMERLVGADFVVLIDAIATGKHAKGTVLSFPLSSLPDLTSEHMTSAHDTSLPNAIQLGRKMGASLPSQIFVVGIEAENLYNFTEELSSPVAAAIPRAVEEVIKILSQ